MRSALVALLLLGSSPALAQRTNDEGVADDFRRALECPGSRYCSKVRSCREAVHSWCVCGYDRADADDDKVPCENLCGDSTESNLERVRRIMTALQCEAPE